ncbi:hypothetical protein LZ32DRAFT_68106 [Colletotrichum eremochloae]|nr:hypothetical protein LZ32DRAFT_68106 [Colletotrichum eremochloae]
MRSNRGRRQSTHAIFGLRFGAALAPTGKLESLFSCLGQSSSAAPPVCFHHPETGTDHHHSTNPVFVSGFICCMW